MQHICYDCKSDLNLSDCLWDISISMTIYTLQINPTDHIDRFEELENWSNAESLQKALMLWIYLKSTQKNINEGKHRPPN